MKTAIVRREAGFTLVELMVALVIGLVLTLVIAQLFIGSRRTFSTTDDVSRMQENIRFATQILTRTIHQAGYRTSPNASADAVFLAPNLVVETVPAGGLVLDEGIIVRYQGNLVDTVHGSVVNCAGQIVPPGVMSADRFTIENVGKTDAGVVVQVPSLICRTSTNNFATAATAHVLVSDVQNMKVLYGEDTDPIDDTDRSVDRFVPFNLANADRVMAVRIAMLFRTPNLGTTTATDTTSKYSLNGQEVGPFNDTRARRDVVFTVGIRNRSI